MRLFFALGPGDIVDDVCRKNGGRGETSITFTRQLCDGLARAGHDALLVSSNRRVDHADHGKLALVNCPRLIDGASGLRFHFGMLHYAWTLATMARRFRAELAVIDSGTTHYFLLSLFRLFGIRVAVNLHNVRWASGFPPRRPVARLIRRLDSWFFRRIAAGAMGCSPECEAQVRWSGADRFPYVGWTSQFDPAGFDPSPPDRPATEPFRVVFAGRVERCKGVFDVLAIARLLQAQPGRAVQFEICGDGTALAELRGDVAGRGLGDVVTVRGRLERAALLAAYRAADVVIVPTRRDFCEGMPLVCAEAVLSGRPLVTSRLSNALQVVGDAILAVEPEDVPGYAAAIRRLADDPVLYHRLQSSCRAAAGQFTDPARSYGAATMTLVARIGGG